MEEKSNEKKQQTVMYKGLSVRSEEVQEVMGEVPHWILRRGMMLPAVVVLLLAAGCYCFRYPSYAELEYVLKDGPRPVSIIAGHDGIVRYVRKTPGNVRKGDTIAVLTEGDTSTCFLSPANGMSENNLLYSSGERISKGDTLGRILVSRARKPEVLLHIPRNQVSRITDGMEVRLYGGGTDYVKGRIVQTARIPDAAGIFLARVETEKSPENLAPTGKAKIRVDNKRLIEKFLTER